MRHSARSTTLRRLRPDDQSVILAHRNAASLALIRRPSLVETDQTTVGGIAEINFESLRP